MKFTDFPRRGVDISYYNGVVDWSKLQQTGAVFCIIRVGYGRVTDLHFAKNWGGCKGKMTRWPYWYMDYYSNHDETSSAYGISNAEWGKRQAELCWQRIKDDYDGGLVWLDIESGSPSYSPNIYTVWERAQTIARAFLERIDELTGKRNGIYCSLSKLQEFSPDFTKYPVWVAWYTGTQTVDSVRTAVQNRGFTPYIWQYTPDGDIDGDGTGDGIQYGVVADDDLDLNIWIGTDEQWKEQGAVTIYPEKLVYPVDKSTRISQVFGANPQWYPTSKGHNGVDWACNVGTPIYAMQDGEVIISEARQEKAGYGRQVRIQHTEGVSIYGHLSELRCSKGDIVKAGQVIGLSGGATSDPCSGNSTGPHLHAEYRLPEGAPQVPGGYVYGAIDILPLMEDNEPEPLPEGKVRTLVNLNIRKGAGTNYGIWATAPTGTVLDVLEIKGDWVRCGWNQWALSKYNGVRYLG